LSIQYQNSKNKESENVGGVSNLRDKFPNKCPICKPSTDNNIEHQYKVFKENQNNYAFHLEVIIYIITCIMKISGYSGDIFLKDTCDISSNTGDITFSYMVSSP